MELVYSKDPMKLSGGWGIRPSGMTILFTAGAPAGSRIKDVKIDGKEMEADGIVHDRRMRTGGRSA